MIISYSIFILTLSALTSCHQKGKDGVLLLGGINVTGRGIPEPYIQLINPVFHETFIKKPIWLRSPAYDMAAAAYYNGIDHIVVVCGGHNQDVSSSWLCDCYIYRVNYNNVQQIAKMNQSRAHHEMTTCGSSVFYVFGGLAAPRDENSEPTEVIQNERLSCMIQVRSLCVRWRWDYIAPMPEPRWSFATVCFNGRVYAIGGSRGFETNIITFNTMFIYDTTNNTWSRGVSMPVKRGSLACANLFEVIYCCGGTSDGVNALNTCDIYFTRNNTWAPGPTLNKPRFEPRMVVYRGFVIVMGGAETRGVIEDTIEVLNSTSGRFEIAREKILGAKFLFSAIPMETMAKK